MASSHVCVGDKVCTKCGCEMDQRTRCALGHASPVQECPKCNPLSEASNALAPAGPVQLPEPTAPTVPLTVQDLDDFVSNLEQRRVKRFAFTGNIKGAPVVLEIQFEAPPRRQEAFEE